MGENDRLQHFRGKQYFNINKKIGKTVQGDGGVGGKQSTMYSSLR